MDFIERRLAQARPEAMTNTTIYTVPVNKKTIVRGIIACNTTSAPINIRIFIVPDGGNPSPENAIFYDYEIFENFTYSKTLYLILNSKDSIVVYVSSKGITFTISGAELTES